MKTTLEFAGTTGLDISFDPVRSNKGEGGIVSLSSCSNVDVDKTGSIRTRDGFLSLLSGSKVHSLFDYPEQGGLLCVLGDALAIVSYDGTSVERLRNVDENLRMRFVRAEDNKVYYSNSKEGGKILEMASFPFSFQETLPFSTKAFDQAPIEEAEGLCLHQSRLCLVKGNAVFYSEAFAHEAFALGTNFFQFPTSVRAIQSITPEALFVGTEEGGFLVKGTIGSGEYVFRVLNGRCLDVVLPKTPSMTILGQAFHEVFFVLGSFGVKMLSSQDNYIKDVLVSELDDAKSAFGVHVGSKQKFIFGWR